jgi:hypothetical protein
MSLTSLVGQLAMRSTRALSDVCPNALNGPLPLREHAGKEMPDVDHLFPDFESDIYPCCLGTLRQTCRIIEQGLGIAYMDEQRW